MNLLIVADKADIKTYEAIAKTTSNTTVLGTVTKIDSSFADLLREKYNPHAILIDTDVKTVGISVQSAVDAITQQFPYMKILVLTSEDDSYDYHVDCIVQGQVSNIKLKEILKGMANGSSQPETESNDNDSDTRIPNRITFDSHVMDKLSTAKVKKYKKIRLLRLNPIMLSGIAAGVLALFVVVLVVMKGMSVTGQSATADEAATTSPLFLSETQPSAEPTTEDFDYPTMPVESFTTATVPTTVVPPTIAPEPTVAQNTISSATRSEEKPTAAPQSSGSSGGNSSGNSGGNSGGSSNNNNNGNSNNSSGNNNAQTETRVYGGDPVVSYDDNGRYSNSGGNAASSVKLSYNTKTLSVGDSLKLTASVSPANANQSVTWSSSNSAVVSVSNGQITAKKTGTATITAKANNGVSASCEVTVKNKEQSESVYLSAKEYHVKVGQTITLTLYGTDSCEWSSSNSNAVRLYPNGNQVQLVARRTGSYRVYAKDKKTQKSYTCQIYIE